METGTKNVGGRHNRSCKTVHFDPDDFFKLVSQQLIHEGDWGGVIKNSFENINEIKDLANDEYKSDFQPLGNSEESTKKSKQEQFGNWSFISQQEEETKVEFGPVLETGVLAPEGIHATTNIISKDDLTTEKFIFNYF